MIRALIVDDEPMARSKLRRLLRAAEGVRVVGEAADAPAAHALIREHRPDVVFLDVDLPGRSGLELARTLEDPIRPWIVFATAYAEFAIQAFEVEALDYLLKPFDAERVERVLARLRARMADRGGTPGARIEALIERLQSAGATAPPEEGWARRLVVEQGREMRFVRAEDIDWISSADNYVEVHAAGHRHLLRDTLSAVEARLDPAMFARVHRRSIVNLDRVSAMRSQETGRLELVLRDGTVIPVGRAYRDSLTRRWQGGRAPRP